MAPASHQHRLTLFRRRFGLAVAHASYGNGKSERQRAGAQRRGEGSCPSKLGLPAKLRESLPELLYESLMASADEVIERLGLVPHPEGGFYAETFRAQALPVAAGSSPRSASTAIYFLLKAQEFSALHVVSSADEVWHHYWGDALELHCFDAGGQHRQVRLGAAFAEGERPQHVVLRGELQAARVTAGPHGFALCGCTVAPGFDFADFRMPGRAELLARLPAHAELITALTRA